ncbi:hypothetical protein [Streptomyces dysideae]|nr:hypothetical protein [Streptomyces dysideae]
MSLSRASAQAGLRQALTEAGAIGDERARSTPISRPTEDSAPS